MKSKHLKRNIKPRNLGYSPKGVGLKKFLIFCVVFTFLILSFATIFYWTSDLFDEGKIIYGYVKVNGVCMLTFHQWVEAFGWLVKTAFNIFFIQFFYSLYEETIKKDIVDKLVKKLIINNWNKL